MHILPLPFLVFSLMFVTAISYGQDVDARIDAFNEAIGKEYNVSNKGKILLVNGFREGKQVKTEKVNVFDLDMATLKFSETDNTVSVNCHSDLDGCVDQVLVLDKKKTYRKRLVFGLSDGISGLEIVEKLRLMLNEMVKTY